MSEICFHAQKFLDNEPCPAMSRMDWRWLLTLANASCSCEASMEQLRKRKPSKSETTSDRAVSESEKPRRKWMNEPAAPTAHYLPTEVEHLSNVLSHGVSFFLQ